MEIRLLLLAMSVSMLLFLIVGIAQALIFSDRFDGRYQGALWLMSKAASGAIWVAIVAILLTVAATLSYGLGILTTGLDVAIEAYLDTVTHLLQSPIRYIPDKTTEIANLTAWGHVIYWTKHYLGVGLSIALAFLGPRQYLKSLFTGPPPRPSA